MSEDINTETASAAQTEPEEHAGSFPIPPASIDLLVVSLKAQAEMQMGLLHFGDPKDRPEPDFMVARHTIDLLAVLQDKTRGNLTMDEQRLLENSLTELRFRYVQAMESSRKAKAEGQAQA